MKILNLYAGIGGNRALWENCEVTAVELDEKLQMFINIYIQMIMLLLEML